MPESTVVRVKRDGQIALLDSGGANSYTVAYEAGDFSYDCPAEGVNNFLDRGSIGATPSLRLGDDQPVTFGFSAYLRDVGDPNAVYATLLDICQEFASGGVAANWTSTLGVASDAFTVTVTLTIDGSSFGEADKTLTFSYSVVRSSVSEGDPDTVTVSGTSYAVRPVLS